MTGHGPAQQAGDVRVCRDGGREDEEAEKGDDEHKIHLPEQTAVRYGDGGQDQNHGKGPQGGPGDDDGDDQGEKHQIGDAPTPTLCLPRIFRIRDGDLFPQILPVQKENEEDEQQGGEGTQREHVQHEVSGTHIGLPVQEKGQHGAADGGDVFKGDHREDIVFPVSVPEKQQRQRNEDDQGDIIGDEHGGKEHAKDQKQGETGHPRQP